MPSLRPVATLLVAVALAPRPAAASPTDAGDARLRLWSAAELATIAPFLTDGPVALVEFNADDLPPAIVIATRVAAPADRIAALLADPAGYPRFMPALDHVEVATRHAHGTAYTWTWRTALFSLRGDNVLVHYPPPAERPELGHRLDVRMEGGDLGSGRMLWRVVPEPNGTSLVQFASRLDLRDGSYLPRELSRRGRSINRTMNVSLAFGMLIGTKLAAEGSSAGEASVRVDATPPARPAVVPRRLAGILERGDLLLLTLEGAILARVAVVARMGLGVEGVRPVMVSPEEFGQALLPGSYAQVSERRADGSLAFDWGIRLPLIGTSGRMALRDHDGTVEVDAVAGALAGGRWRFQATPLGRGDSIVLGWAAFDPSEASWLVRLVVEGAPALAHGIAAGTQVMVVRGLRHRAMTR